MTILIEERIETGAPELRWHEVCRVDDLEAGWGEAAWLDGVQVALFRFPDGTVHAASQRCPATGANIMARGIMGGRATAEGAMVRTVASPLHKQVYRLDTGECLNDPSLSLEVFPVHCAGDRVWVGVPR